MPLEFLVLANIGRNHLLHLLGAQKHADAFIIDAGVVAAESESLDPAVTNSGEQALRNSAEAKAAACDKHVVAQHPVERRGGVRIDLAGHQNTTTLRMLSPACIRSNPLLMSSRLRT